MANQIVVSAGAKVRNLQDVIIGTSGVLTSLGFDVANGVPRLDVNGKILVSQLPNSVMEYKGTWNVSTNTPTLVNGTGNQGDVYLVEGAAVGGTAFNFGAGPITFFNGDQAIYSGSIWQRASGATGTVTSVAITESGDSLNITGSPITTSGTINIGFNGTNLQYVNGAGNLTTFPILTGYVPYTGATQNVDLGVYDLTADLITGATGSFASSGGSDTFAINHSSGSGIALNITKGGNGEGLYINKTSGSGNAATIVGTLEATTLVKSGGTSSQFLKADGTVDSSTYALDSLVVHLAGTETITGSKTFSGYTTFTSTVDITSGLTFSNSGFTLVLQPPTLSVNRTVTLPNGTGTLALTSDISYPVTSVFGRTGAIVATEGDYSLTQLSDVTITSPTTNQVLKYNGSAWVNDTDANTGTVTSVGLSSATSGVTIGSTPITTSGTITLAIATATTSQNGLLSSTDWTTFNGKQAALNGTGFVKISGTTISYDNSTYYLASNPSAFIALTALSAGVGISYNNTTGVITNSAPDQVVALTASTGISVTGTYPNFTITNTSPSSGGTVTSVAALTIGTSGTDLSSSVANSTTTPVITLNVPTASATNRGALSSADWTTFNNKQSALTNPVTGTGTTNTLPKFTAASTIGNSNITDTGSLITLGSNSYVNGNLSVGNNNPNGWIAGIVTSNSFTGGSSVYGNIADGTIQSAVTNTAGYFRSQSATAAASFTLANLNHFDARQATFGAGSAVTTQRGFWAGASLIGATNNYGFQGSIPSGTNRWNIYMDGTANNYMAGSLGIGSTNLSGYNLRVSGSMQGVTTYYGIANTMTVQPSVTSSAIFYSTSAATAASAFTLTNLFHYQAGQGAIGATSAVTNQYGYFAASTLVGATNNYGFYGDIPAATGDWNLYMNGTAANYLAGKLLIGSTTDSGATFQVTGTAKISSTLTASSLIKSGGTAAQILAADGSVITAGTGISISGGVISSTVVGGVTSFNTRTGAVTLTSGDVTGALGFTPYNATNPSGYITSSASITGTSAGVVNTVSGTNSAELVRGNMADNDQFRILVGGTATNAGYAEIATADDGTEPIYVRQYTGTFTTLTRTATLLDGSGNTSFPGTLTASNFSGSSSGTNTGDQDLSGYLTTASAASTYLPLSGGTLTGRLTINVTNNYGVLMNRPATSNYVGLLYSTNSTANWFVGLRETGTSNYIVYNEGLGTDAFTINSSNSAATFSSSVTALNYFSTAATTGYAYSYYENTGAAMYMGIERSTGQGLFTGSSAYATVFGSTNATSLQFGTNGIIRATITSGGNVLIGTTDDGGKLVSYSTTAATQIKAAGTAPAISFSNTVLSPTIGGSLGACTAANQFLTGTAAGDMILINQFTGNNLYITNYSGGVYLSSGATSWTANSDIRLKNINSHIENAVEKLSTLQTINFSYKDDKTNKQNIGLIAQEVEKIFPELIDKNGDGMLGVRYTELVPVLIKAVQELKLEIETLKNK